MKIEDAGELRSFETVPAEMTLFLSVVRFDSGGWGAGPNGESKEAVVNALMSHWKHVTDARIYSVKLPISLRREESDHAR